MKTNQYTIRSVPHKLDKRLRDKASRSGKSLNTVVLEALEKAENLAPKQKINRDLDWFIGSGTLDQKKFDESQEWLDNLPNDL